jgi:hypothetical protein
MKKIIGILLLAILLVASCRNKEQLGPDLVGIYGPVTIVTPLAVNTPSVNFATGGMVFFTASFQNSAVWTITITGSNGAQKVITGISKEINAENSTWAGQADFPPSFLAGSATATLSFKNSVVTESVSFNITAKPNSDLSSDVLVTDFVINRQICYCSLPPAPNDTVPKNRWPNDWPGASNTNSTYTKPDGNAYMFMGPATAWQGGGSPYVDVLRISARNSIVNYGKYYPLYADPSKVYFNIMVYNTGTPTWLQISFFEEEQDGTPGAGPDRHLTIKPNWIGWKLISVKYSDLIANNSAAAANVQPQKVSDIQIVLFSNVPTANLLASPTDPMVNVNVSTAFDHITFTHNAPYQP